MLLSVICILTGAIASGCQATQDTALLQPAAAVADQGAPAPTDIAEDVSSDTAGSGPVIIGLALPKTLTVPARDFRDGAKLAVRELASEMMTLMPLDGISATSAEKLGAVVGVGREGGVMGGDVPVVVMADGNGGSYDIVSDEMSSAEFMISLAVAAGRSEIAVLVPSSFSEQDEARLRKAVKSSSARLTLIERYPLSLNAAQFAERHATDLARSAALLVFGGGSAPATAVATVRQAGLPSGVQVLGTTAWDSVTFAEAAVDGALVPRLDRSGWQQVAAAYQAGYGRPLSIEAAYGFDSIAMLTALLRAHGERGIAPELIESKAGFRGLTGPFRFTRDGKVDRLFALQRVEGGTLNAEVVPPTGFAD